MGVVHAWLPDAGAPMGGWDMGGSGSVLGV